MASIASALVTPQMPQGNATATAATLQSSKNKDSVNKAAKEFESVYMQQMLSHMWEGLDTNGPFGGGHGEEVFRSLMIEQYGKMIADSGQTKIASSMTGQILRMQEEQHNPRGMPPQMKTGEAQ